MLKKKKKLLYERQKKNPEKSILNNHRVVLLVSHPHLHEHLLVQPLTTRIPNQTELYIYHVYLVHTSKSYRSKSLLSLDHLFFMANILKLTVYPNQLKTCIQIEFCLQSTFIYLYNFHSFMIIIKNILSCTNHRKIIVLW